MRFGETLLDHANGLGRIQMLRASVGAVHDGLAAIQLERIVECVQALLRELIARIGDPAIRLH